MKKQPVYYTAGDIASREISELPDEFVLSRHLIYSSPATLAFNSPGAEGFGVKRAGLAIAGSVMLLVAPGCCGRNTSLVSEMKAYEGRFFYLNMDETDIVTGRHLKKIPDAVREIAETTTPKPSLVMICITCTDALLGTDMERICRKAEAECGIHVRPCYMYALTREGRKPPMVHVRESLYTMLAPRKKDPRAVNLLGFFAPLMDDSELYELLSSIGIRTVREISRCRDFDDFLTMAEANFNLVLNPEARRAAEVFEKDLQIPSIELTRFYEPDRIHRQYEALGAALGVTFDDAPYFEEAKAAVHAFRDRFGALTFSVGECTNGDAFELALALVRFGFQVAEVFATVTDENMVYIRYLADLSPDTRIYANTEPTMIFYEPDVACDVTIGKDAGFYHPECPCLPWNSDVQPYGFRGLTALLKGLTSVLEAAGNKDMPHSDFASGESPADCPVQSATAEADTCQSLADCPVQSATAEADTCQSPADCPLSGATAAPTAQEGGVK